MTQGNNEKLYKDHYLIYSRKSTDDAENQKNSLAYQISEAVKLAKSNQLRIAPVSIPGFCTYGQIREKHSGSKEDEEFVIHENGTVSYRVVRPKFFRLVKYLRDGYFKGVIFLCWDRASRNENDDGLLKKLMKQSDIHFVQTKYDVHSSSGKLHMDIDGTFSQHYSRVLSEKIRNQNKKLREEGVCIYKAPIGYLNQGDSRNKPFDLIRAPIIKSLFVKYAEGTWTLIELAEWAQKQGLTMPAVRRKRTPEEMLSDEETIIEPICRPVTYKNIHVILTNPFYIGKIRDRQNNWRDSISHQPLISPELFYRVQDVLKSKKVSVHYIEKPYFPYRGIMRCAHCGRVYSPYEQKGIHYYGARCDKSCMNTKRNINSTFIEEKIGEVLSHMFYSGEELAKIENELHGDLKRLEKKRQEGLLQIRRQKGKIREELAYLRENKLTFLKSSVYTPEAFLEEESKLNQVLEKLQIEEQDSDGAIQEAVKDLVRLSELLKNAYLHYYFAKPNEKKEIIQKVFSELTLDRDTLNYKVRNGFKLLDPRSMSLGEGNVWISEAVRNHNFILDSIEDLRTLSPPLKMAS